MHRLTLEQAAMVGLIRLEYQDGKLAGYEFKHQIAHDRQDFGCVWLKDVQADLSVAKLLSAYQQIEPVPDQETLDESIRSQLNDR